VQAIPFFPLEFASNFIFSAIFYGIHNKFVRNTATNQNSTENLLATEKIQNDNNVKESFLSINRSPSIESNA
jgi:hypothetical protein